MRWHFNLCGFYILFSTRGSNVRDNFENWANIIISKDTLEACLWVFVVFRLNICIGIAYRFLCFEAFGLNRVNGNQSRPYQLFPFWSVIQRCLQAAYLFAVHFFFLFCHSANRFDIFRLQHFDMLIIIKLAYFYSQMWSNATYLLCFSLSLSLFGSFPLCPAIPYFVCLIW